MDGLKTLREIPALALSGGGSSAWRWPTACSTSQKFCFSMSPQRAWTRCRGAIFWELLYRLADQGVALFRDDALYGRGGALHQVAIIAPANCCAAARPQLRESVQGQLIEVKHPL